ncbi:MAG: sulfite exporter TauE/SafE family protein [Pseudomonadota bacterium]
MPDLTLLALGVPAAIWAGISKGGFGSGAAFASALLLALIVDPATALGIMLPVLLLIDALTLRPFWGQWHGPSARALILGGIPGVGLGIALFAVASDDVLRLLIAAVALGFVAWQLAGQMRWIRVRPAPFRWSAGLGTGVLAGFTSFISHAGGPAVAVFLLAQGLAKTTFQATTVIAFAVLNLVKAVPYGVMGFFTAETLMLGLWLAPAAVLGTWIGIKAHARVPETLFFSITYVLLTITGLKLVWDALT